jgi:hypothetical protein
MNGNKSPATDDLQDDLRNTQSLIRVTRLNLDALIARFAHYRSPPPCYLDEYNQLTCRLHDLEARESDLRDQIAERQEAFFRGSEEEGGADSDEQGAFPQSPLVGVPFNLDPGGACSSDESGGRTSGTSSSVILNAHGATKSPYKRLIRFFLPYDQRTSLQVRVSLFHIVLYLAILSFSNA